MQQVNSQLLQSLILLFIAESFPRAVSVERLSVALRFAQLQELYSDIADLEQSGLVTVEASEACGRKL